MTVQHQIDKSLMLGNSTSVVPGALMYDNSASPEQWCLDRLD